MIRTFLSVIDGMVCEAEVREDRKTLTISEYGAMRRKSAGLEISYVLGEYACQVDIPDFVFEDRTFQDMYWAAADLVSLANVC